MNIPEIQDKIRKGNPINSYDIDNNVIIINDNLSLDL